MTEYAVGDTFETTTEPVDRTDFVKYAGASGDFTPIHYNEPFTTDAGYESVFAQGMFTAGVASRAVREAFGLQALREYRTRFVAQVWPDETLTTTVEVTDVEETGGGTRVEASVTVTTQDDETVIEGSAAAVV